MITLILGTPDSGKSLLAEKLAMEQSGNASKYYIATMVPFGEEGKSRIQKHRKMREGKGFITLEWPDNIRAHVEAVDTKIINLENAASESIDFSNATVLLECMSNLVGNEMYSKDNVNASDDYLTNKIIDGVKQLEQAAKNLIVVTNQFDLYDEQYDEETKRYVKLIARVNEELIRISKVVYSRENGEWQSNENN